MPVHDRTPIWLDCDPGHDDAFAILLAGHSPSLCLLGISTVHGNQTIERTTRNAASCLRAFGLAARGTKVVAGAARPLIVPSFVCPEIHGESGLDGVNSDGTPKKNANGLPAPLPESIIPSHTYLGMKMGENVKSQPDHTNVTAISVMYDAIMALPAEGKKAVIVATGALTNIALLLTTYPHVVTRIQRICFMGGAIGVGNTSPVAEFNIQVDPHAAQIVVNAPCEVVMVPLEVTHTALVTDCILNRLSSLVHEQSSRGSAVPGSSPSKRHRSEADDGDTAAARLVDILKGLLLFFKKTYKKVYDLDSPPLHDPCAVAYCIAPDIFTADTLRVDVECSSALSRGQTVVNWLAKRNPEGFAEQQKRQGYHDVLNPNVIVTTKMDVDKFWDLQLEAIARALQVADC